MPRWLRICLLVRLIMPWRLPAWVARILPVAVMRKRFLHDDFVLHLGHFASFGEAFHAGLEPGIESRRGMPCRAGSTAGVIESARPYGNTVTPPRCDRGSSGPRAHPAAARAPGSRRPRAADRKSRWRRG